MSVVQGAADALENGLTIDNTLQAVGGIVGFAGNLKGISPKNSCVTAQMQIASNDPVERVSGISSVDDFQETNRPDEASVF